MRIAPLFVALPLLLVTGCGNDRHTPGIMISPDGQTSYTNSTNIRAETERIIERSLNNELKPNWRSKVTVAEEPRWHDIREAWLWKSTAVRVELLGDGTVPAPLDTPTITDAVVKYFAGRLVDSKQTVQVDVVTVATAPPATRPVPMSVPLSATTPAADQQRYVIQAGDTLARISAVFYGSPKHWRLIVEANPGLVPEALRVGQEIVIPALPPAAP